MNLSENALNAYNRLYFAERFSETTPNEVHLRVSKFAASAELDDDGKTYWENTFFNMLDENQFRPNSPTMMNAGVVPNPQTSACFVGALGDSLTEIFDFDREAGFIYAQGSGLGGNYGMLREAEAPLSTGGASSGPFAFMKKLAATAEAVKSGGRNRRAAHMAMMFDHHPDIEKFITLKDGKDQTFASMNLSVAASDAFMQAVEEDGDWKLKRVVDGAVVKTMKARDLFNLIITNAHKSGDPGFWFIDRSNRDNTLKNYGRIVSTNPCGEQALLPRQCCALGAINLVSCLVPRELGGEVKFGWDKFKAIVTNAVRFIDNCIDISGFPTPDYNEMALASRPIGLGIMGFADALIMMGMPYDSQKAFNFAGELSQKLTKYAIKASLELAEEKGAFPLWKTNRESTLEVVGYFLDKDFDEDRGILERIEVAGLRNSQWTTIAPTGTVSISCDCSQGMEPLFGICYDKILSDTNETWTFVNPLFGKWYEGEEWFAEALPQIVENHGSCQGIKCIPEAVQELWPVAHDIDWEARIDMQAALQDGISNSISSTVNLPNDATAKTIGDIYLAAWKRGLKGLTVYRDGCLEFQPVSFGKTKEKPAGPDSIKNVPLKLKKIRHGNTHEINTGHGKVYLTVNSNEEGLPVEVFANGAKNGSVSAANLEALGRLVSIALQEGVPVKNIARTIENINDGTIAWDRISEADTKSVPITSIPDAMGKILRRFYCDEGEAPLAPAEECPNDTPVMRETVVRCPQCNSVMGKHDGCDFCPQCGSQCG